MTNENTMTSGSVRLFLIRCLIPAIQATLLLSTTALAQHAQPYTGQGAREIKALSADEVKQYRAGAGAGFALAAELNHFPGPMHVLELADSLKLSATQREQTSDLMAAHKADARAIGERVIAAERTLDKLFASARVEQLRLAEAVRAVAQAQGEYRLSHLETHRRMRLLLTDEQVAAYDQLRGYASGTSTHGHQH